MPPRYIRFRHPPLSGHAFVNEGFTVGEEGGDLGLQIILESAQAFQLIHSIINNRLNTLAGNFNDAGDASGEF
jgi:hypothetical protein